MSGTPALLVLTMSCGSKGIIGGIPGGRNGCLSSFLGVGGASPTSSFDLVSVSAFRAGVATAFFTGVAETGDDTIALSQPSLLLALLR